MSTLINDIDNNLMTEMESWFETIENHPNAVRLDKGQPNLQIPPVKGAIKDYLEDRKIVPYTLGLSELKEEIASYLYKSRGVKYDPEKEIIIVHGAISGLYATMSAFSKDKSKILIPTPCWPAYYDIAISCNLDISLYNFVNEEDKNKFCDNLYIKDYDMLLLNSPHNPTGTIIEDALMNKLAIIADKRKKVIISDETYLDYSSKFLKAQSPSRYVKDKGTVIIVNSLSKQFAMTGFRVGYIASSESNCNIIKKEHALMTGGITPITQVAAISAFKDYQYYIEKNIDVIDKRRKKVFDVLEKYNIPFDKKKGGMYIFLKLKDNIESLEFCRTLLSQDIACVPGYLFGKRGEHYIRIALFESEEILEKTLKKIIKLGRW